jgi:hypothetical protein
MKELPLFQVVVLPKLEVLAQMATLAEATAWARSYNAVMEDESRRAVVVVAAA